MHYSTDGLRLATIYVAVPFPEINCAPHYVLTTTFVTLRRFSSRIQSNYRRPCALSGTKSTRILLLSRKQ